MKVRFLDLSVKNSKERKALLKAVDQVLIHGQLINGPEVQLFEKKIAALCKRKYAIGVGSGTDALFLGLKALGIGPGDEVITTSLSWVGTANGIALTGATPVFADIGDDLNIDPQSVRKLITKKTKAILPVHYTGKMSAIAQLEAIAKKHKILLIEDAAQAFKANIKGRPSGSYGQMGCFSLNPMKVFAACGEAGVIVVDDHDVYEKLIALRYNGTVNKETCLQPSLNGRLDTIQAAILLERLKNIDELIAKRRRVAGWYDQLLKGVVGLPVELKNEFSVYYTYMIQVDDRDKLKAYLESKGIEVKIQHPILMPDQPAYKKNVKGKWTNAQRIVKRILCIPVHEKLTKQEVQYVADSIKSFYLAKGKK